MRMRLQSIPGRLSEKRAAWNRGYTFSRSIVVFRRFGGSQCKSEQDDGHFGNLVGPVDHFSFVFLHLALSMASMMRCRYLPSISRLLWYQVPVCRGQSQVPVHNSRNALPSTFRVVMSATVELRACRGPV